MDDPAATLGGHPGESLSVEIALLTPGDWVDLRDIRLRALADAPEAFVALPSCEATWTRRDWLRTFESGVWAVARVPGRMVGLARSVREGRSRRHLEAVWVEPDFRRRRVATLLVSSLVARELDAGAAEILLWIVSGNEAARGLYERIGFRLTGERQPIPGDATRLEERLRLLTPFEPAMPLTVVTPPNEVS